MAKKSTQKKKASAKAASKKTVKKATAKPIVKIKKVIKKSAAKPKVIKKPIIKKIATKKVSSKPISKHKKIVAKPKLVSKKKIVKVKAQSKKKIVKAKVKIQPKKKIIKAAPKKVIKNAKQKVSKKPVKKIVHVKVRPAPKKVETKKVQAKVKKVVKKVLPKIVEKPVVTKVFNNPKIVSVKNIPGYETTFNRADMFYKNMLKAESIKRFSEHREEDKEFIAKDHNLHIKIADKETPLSISEKSRDQDWNDIHVEIFKKYPLEDGWIKLTEAEYLAYFFPGRVFWAKMEPIKILCQDILSKAVESGIYKELYYMFPKNSGRLSKTFKINQKTYSFNFIQTYHENGENSYYSIGISLPFVLLMDFRIDYKIFKQ
jgi:hypothetical protein